MRLDSAPSYRHFGILVLALSAIAVAASSPVRAQPLDPPWDVVRAAAEEPDLTELRSILQQEMTYGQRHAYLERALVSSPAATIRAIMESMGDLRPARRRGLARKLVWAGAESLDKRDWEQADRILGLVQAYVDDPEVLGRLAVSYADADRWDTAASLLRRGGRIDPYEIRERVDDGDLEFVLWLIDQGYGARGIGAMAFRRNSELHQQLAGRGLSPDTPESVSESPRERALAYLKAGVDPCLNEMWRQGGEFPGPQQQGRCLRTALENGHEQLAGLYLDAGADASVAEERNPEWSDSALELAAGFGDLDLMRRLRRAGSPETFREKFETPARVFWKQLRWNPVDHDVAGHTLRLPALFDVGCTKPSEPEWNIECESSQDLTVRAAFRIPAAIYHRLRLERSFGLERPRFGVAESTGGETASGRWVHTVRGSRGQLDITIQVVGPRLNAPEIDLGAEFIFYDVRPAPLQPYVQPGSVALVLVAGITAALSLVLILLHRSTSEATITRPDVWT